MSSTYWDDLSEYDYSESSESYDDNVDEGVEEEEDEEAEEEEGQEQCKLKQPDNSLEDLLDVEAACDDTGSAIVEYAASNEKCAEYTAWCDAARREITEKRKKERRQSLIQAAKIVGAFLLILLLLIGVVAVSSYFEQHRMRGMIFETRIEKLPLELPPGKLQLRTYMHAIHRGRVGQFTPFVASSESEGKLHVITNATHPYFNAYYVEHPEIWDVMMITDDFFCSPVMCFYLTDSNNDSFFKNSTVIYRNLTYQLVEVPLPEGIHFITAEYCTLFGNWKCSIIVEANATRRLASVVKRKRFGMNTYVVDMSMKETAEGDFRASQLLAEPNRIINWYEGKLEIFHPSGAILTAFIDDVEREEVVEVLPLNEDVHIVLVMKEKESETRVRINALAPDNNIIRRDELIIPSPPSAITALIYENTFEICHLTRSQIECFVNLVKSKVNE